MTSNSTKVERLPKKHVDSKFNYGDIVYHKTFGKGIVRQFYSGTKTYRVRFYGNLSRSTQVVEENDLSIKPIIGQPYKAMHHGFSVGTKVYSKEYGNGIIRDFSFNNIYKVFFPISMNPSHTREFTLYINSSNLSIKD